MIEGTDYNLADLYGQDFFSPNNVRCPYCWAMPGIMCPASCNNKDDRTLFYGEVIDWMKLHFEASIRGQVNSYRAPFDMKLWVEVRRMPSMSIQADARHDYTKMRIRAFSKRRISSMRVLHEWDTARNKDKLKGNS